MRNTANLRHENIVKIEGFYIDEDKVGHTATPVIVFEWARGGTMREYTRNISNYDARQIVSTVSIGIQSKSSYCSH